MTLPVVYPILDTATLARRDASALLAAEAFLEAGCGILQLRHKEHFTRDLFAMARAIADLCRAANVPFLMNDRADIARLLGAGLHLGQDDLPPAEARRILGPDAPLGFSTHNAKQLEEAATEPATYLALGPIFHTASKENPDAVVGISMLTAWRKLSPMPLVAIGGITRENACQVIAAGADSVAVISDLYPAQCTKQNLRERMEEWLKLLQ